MEAGSTVHTEKCVEYTRKKANNKRSNNTKQTFNNRSFSEKFPHGLLTTKESFDEYFTLEYIAHNESKI